MELKFDSNLKYQNEAIKAVTDLFEGQITINAFFSMEGQSGFDYYNYNEDTKTLYQDEQTFGQGVGNKLTISKQDILENLRKVQTFHKLAPSESLNSLDFNIEMETGTGKTYVYLKTIFELNKKYGFTKFIIVVPSVAIKEGVYKTIQITKKHFKELYNKTPNTFVYDSSDLEQVRNFAVNSDIEIMIINISAFNKSKNFNIINREHDMLSGYKAIDIIAETNPIVIIDEPQSVMGGKGEQAVASLNPLCTLRYSATHREIQNLIYKLDAVDAYEMNLVKGIEVASLESLNYHKKPYIKLLSVNNTNNQIKAKVEVDVNVNGSIKRQEKTLRATDDLVEITNREIYKGLRVEEIYCGEGNEHIKFTPKELRLELGESYGNISDKEIKRAQIRKTIEEHLDKELFLNRKGIKVLSLFFIDKVSNYRIYDDDGNPHKGEYAKIFEKEYKDVIKNPKYSTLYKDIDLSLTAEEVHNGYFAQDKGRSIDNLTKKGKLYSNDKTNDAFNLIMRDKEKLLSFDSKLKFIFSHSALKEGWDNPNVFQICTLNETNSTMKKRQEIGRGLRLCVNQDGERVHDKSINILTIMANESYDSFAKGLQHEMEKDVGIKFGIIESSSFAHIIMEKSNGKVEPIDIQGSRDIFNHFKLMNYVNGKGKVQEALKVAIKENKVSIPPRYESIKEEIIEVATKHTKSYEIKNATLKRKVHLKKGILLDPQFKEIWDRIKQKTNYSVDFDTDDLISKCKVALKDLDVHTPKLIYSKSGLVIEAGGVSVDEEGSIHSSVVFTEEEEVALPDIVSYLQNETYLTRKTIVRILKESGTLEQFKINPQEYMESVLKIVKKVLNSMLVDGIKYTQTDEFYSQQLFEKDELYGYLEKNLIEAKKSIYDYVLFDSDVERKFALSLDNDPQVKLYAKLPQGFKIKTPIGGYNPDWAVLLEDNTGANKMYFVVETKGNIDSMALRDSEKFKIYCGEKHFKALDTGVKFKTADNFKDFKINIE